jgi:hypothetical protein
MSDWGESVEHTDQREKLARLIQDAEAGILDFMSFESPPDDPKEREVWGCCVWSELFRIFRARLSREQIGLVQSLNANPETTPLSHDEALLIDKLDEVLIEQTAALGWRMFLSRAVVARIARWSDAEPDGIDKLRRFTTALIRHAEVKRAKARLPFTEQEWPQTRKNALREIKVLQKVLSPRLAVGKPCSTATQASALIRAEIAAKRLTYSYLAANLRSFVEYLETASLSLVFATGQISPGTVLNGWFDHQGSTADDKSRQIISRLASKKRR